MTVQLNDEQRAAVEADHPRFTVMAAAGSGKTRVLVERYVRLVRDGVSPERLVTITFSKKAAAEMKRRIVARLVEEGRRQEAQAAETGPVQTIHSFCERILRSQAIDAGVDPDFSVLDDADSYRLRLQALHDVLRLDIGSLPDAQHFVDQVGGDSTYRSTRLDSHLHECVQAVLELRSTLVDPDAIRAWSTSPETVLARQAAFLHELTGGLVPADASPQEIIDALAAAKGRTGPKLHNKASAAAERDAAAMTAGLVQLSMRVWDRLEAVMEARQSFDYSGLERKALALLQSHDGGAAVRSQIDAVLVDEGQDLNPTQHALLAALDAPCEMVVGDPRQSIYGFRQADVSLFNRRLEEHPRLDLSRNYRSTPPLVKFVDKLYPLLTGEPKAVTEVDTSLGVEELLGGVEEDFEGTVEVLHCHMSGYEKLTADRISGLVQEGVGPGDIAVLTRHGKSGAAIAKLLRQRGVPVTVVGGSKGFMTNIEVLDVANVLEALIDPSNDFAVAAVLLSPFVGLTLDSLVLLSARRPLVSSIKQNPLEDEEENEKLGTFMGWFERQAGTVDRSTAWETLASLFAQTPFLRGLARQPDSAQALANVRKLLTMAASTPDVGPVDFAHLIRELRTSHTDLTEPEIDDDSQGVVQVMTIHKAKGLEFDHVFLPDMHATEPSPGNVLVDARSGLVVYGDGRSVVKSLLANEQKVRNMQELKRVFYVGLTRAKLRAYITLQTGASNGLTPELYLHLNVGTKTWPGVILRTTADEGE